VLSYFGTGGSQNGSKRLILGALQLSSGRFAVTGYACEAEKSISRAAFTSLNVHLSA
jgi:hypothetical protein